MSRMRMRTGSIAFVAARALALAGGAVFSLAAMNPARASDPDRTAALAAEAPRETDAYAGAGTGGARTCGPSSRRSGRSVWRG